MVHHTTPTAEPNCCVHIRQGYAISEQRRDNGCQASLTLSFNPESTLSIRPVIVDHLDVRGSLFRFIPAYGSSHFHAILYHILGLRYSTRSLREFVSFQATFRLFLFPFLPPNPTTILSWLLPTVFSSYPRANIRISISFSFSCTQPSGGIFLNQLRRAVWLAEPYTLLCILVGSGPSARNNNVGRTLHHGRRRICCLRLSGTSRNQRGLRNRA